MGKFGNRKFAFIKRKFPRAFFALKNHFCFEVGPSVVILRDVAILFLDFF